MDNSINVSNVDSCQMFNIFLFKDVNKSVTWLDKCIMM